jgi:hypothetical protein
LSVEGAIPAGTVQQYYRGDKTWATLDKAAVGLDQVDNTSDLAKPISTATQAALDLKSNVGHTHTASDVTDFAAATDAEINAHLAAGENITFNTTTGQLVISSKGGYVYAPVTLATTDDISDLQNPPTTIDGVAIPNLARVLVRAQTNHIQNGIYVYNEGVLVRASDMPTGASLVLGALIYAIEGTTYGGSLFVLNSDDVSFTSVVVNSDGINVQKVAGGTSTSLTVQDTEAGVDERSAITDVQTMTFGNGLTTVSAETTGTVEVISVIKTRTLNLNIDVQGTNQ